MPAIGITGGIATGKSAFCDALRVLLPAARIFNADEAARELVTSDAEVRRELVAEFGVAIFSAAGELNRSQLRSIVFASAERRGALERILHPRIRRRWSAEAKTSSHSQNYFFADIPLLYETAGEKLCDRVVVVACAPDLQLERLRQRAARAQARAARTSPATVVPDERRPSIDSDVARQMIASQMPLTDKIARADHVVWNDGDLDLLNRQAKRLVDLWQTEAWTN
jgi:dephospho-CoA kinase